MKTDQILEAIKNNLEVETKSRQLVVDSVEIQEEETSKKKEQKAALNGQNYADKIYVNAKLIDKESGKVISKDRIKVADLPKKSNVMTYIVDGNHNQTTNQKRLGHAPYLREMNDGRGEVKFNTGKGPTFATVYNPSKNEFKAKFGQSEVDLYPLMKVMGHTDEELKDSWGKKVFDKNVIGEDKYHNKLRSIYNKVVYTPKKVATLSEMETEIREALNGTTLDPKKTKLTMGVSADKVNKQLLGRATENILGYFRGEREEDNRDDMVFSDYHEIDSQYADAIKSRRRAINKKIYRKINKAEEVSDLIDYNAFNKQIKDVIVNGKLSNATETTNILDLESNDSKATIMGEKGISNKSAVTAEARSVAPSSAGFIDPVKTGAGDPGTSFHIPIGAERGENNDLLINLYNTKTKKVEKISNHDIYNQKIAYPGEFVEKDGEWVTDNVLVKGFQKGKFAEFRPNEVDYIMLDGRLMYSAAVNMVPFMTSDSGPRTMFGSNQLTQSVSLVNREAPIVQNGLNENLTFERVIGEKYTTQSPVNGEVVKILDDEIHIKSGKKVHKVEIYKNMNLNQGGFIDESPLVSVGDKVKKGQNLTDNNFTRDGELALGTNLNLALMPFDGFNYEDAIVISDVAAQEKLVSQHLAKFKYELSNTDVINKSKFISLFPGKSNRVNMDQIGDDGVIKVGSKVQKGDILATILSPKEVNKDDASAGLINKMRNKMFKSSAMIYTEEEPGIVTDVSYLGKRIQVNVKYTSPMKVGDKLSARDGGKGIVAAILPQEDMPYRYNDDGEKEYADVIQDPHGVPSRANPGQIGEMGATKIVRKRGDKKYIVENQQSITDYARRIKREQQELGIKDKDVVFLGDDNPVSDINMAPKYMVKLKHQIDHKVGVRTPFGDDGWDMNMKPIKGKSTDHLMAYSMLGHGAYENAAEMATNWKAEKNDQLWDHIRKGGNYTALPKKQETFAFKKFEDMLRSAGVNVRRNQNRFSLAPMTDNDILELSNGAITNAGTINMKNMSAVKGGLFDHEITGGDKMGKDNFDNLFTSELTGGTGQAGTKWAHIDLPFRMVTPMYERPVAKLLGITKADIHKIAKGEKDLNGETGTEAIYNALASINLPKMRESLEEQAKSAKKAKYNDIRDQIDYVKALQKNKQKPQDAYMTSKVAVLPPILRPIVELPNGSKRAADVNYHYRNLVASSEKYNEARDLYQIGAVKNKDLNAQYDEVVKTVKQLHGLEKDDMDNKKGIIAQIAGTGSQPKEGFFQSEVVSRKQELSSRSTIVADPTLSMDEVGIGETVAWEKYAVFVQNALVKKGYTPLDARTAVENKTPVAKAQLEVEMKKRPLLFNRAPSWQIYNVAAFRPKIMPETRNSGKQFHFPNLPVNSFFGGDYDGDQMQAHVPIGITAVEEAKRMFPSNFLYKAGYHNKLMLKPEHSAVYGLYKMTEKAKEVEDTKFFKSVDEAIKAERKKNIELNEIININGDRTTLGRKMINHILPNRYRLDDNTELDAPNISKLLKDISKDKEANYREILDGLNQVGNKYATTSGLSIGIDDLIPKNNFVQEVYDKTDKKIISRIAGKKLSRSEIDAIKIEEYQKAQKKIEESVLDNLSDDNAFKTMARIKSKGNAAQIRQITASFGLAQDERGNAVPIPVKRSFGEGLSPAEYYIQQIGARGGIVQKAEGTSRPGEIGKELIALGSDRSITEKDCGTDKGVWLGLDSLDIYDRYTQSGNNGIPSNKPVVHRYVTELKNQGINKIFVRSPLTCEANEGVCQHCYGMNENGMPIAIGTNVGILDAQVLTESSANASMKSFHTTGAGKGTSGFDRYEEILRMPEKIKNKSILSVDSGRVEKVKKNEFGGFDVTVGANTYSTNHFEPLNIKVGDYLEKGDQITKGVIKPQELLDLKGIDAVQEYMTDELANVFEAKGKSGDMKRRTFENVISGLTSTVQVTDAGDSDVTPFTFMNKNKVIKINNDLLRKAVSNGETPNLIQSNSILKSSKQMPLEKDHEWLAQTDYRHIKDQLMRSAAIGATSDVAGRNVVSRYAFGAKVNSYMKNETPLYQRPLSEDAKIQTFSGFQTPQPNTVNHSNRLMNFAEDIKNKHMS